MNILKGLYFPLEFPEQLPSSTSIPLVSPVDFLKKSIREIAFHPFGHKSRFCKNIGKSTQRILVRRQDKRRQSKTIEVFMNEDRIEKIYICT